MAEYWKSTPTYWCKFCTQYVRDTPLERRNHESSGRHQNNIQRSLRQLHKNKEQEDRQTQRAKDEVKRLNGLVNGKGKAKVDHATEKGILGVREVKGAGLEGGGVSTAAQRKAHAEQLAALGVQLPEELKREVTGVGGWEVVSERVVEDESWVLKKEEQDVDRKEGIVKGVHKRKLEDEDENAEAERASRAWGSRIKTYPGDEADHGTEGGEEDLDALLSGVGKKRKVDEGGAAEVKRDEAREDGDTQEVQVPEADAGSNVDAQASAVKDEDGEEEKPLADAPPAVVFKKRKGKK